MEKKVVAAVGGRNITEEDVDYLVKGFDPQTAARFNSEDGRKSLLQELINQELFYLDALENGLDREEEFTSGLERVKEGYIKQYAINKFLKGILVSEDEIRELYEGSKDSFMSPESVRASHILVDDEVSANRILKEIGEGLPFEAAAKKYSKCPSGEEGGDLGSFTRGQMVPEFERAAFSMSEGEMSHPVKTQFGYHIIKLTGKSSKGGQSFEEVREQLMRQLVANKQQEAYYGKVGELKGKYRVEMKV